MNKDKWKYDVETLEQLNTSTNSTIFIHKIICILDDGKKYYYSKSFKTLNNKFSFDMAVLFAKIVTTRPNPKVSCYWKLEEVKSNTEYCMLPAIIEF